MKLRCLLILIVVVCLLSSCAKQNMTSSGSARESWTTDTWSTKIEDHDEKIQFLQKYVQCPAEVVDTKFHIVYHDNSQGLVPGPSDWRVAAAIKINQSDVDAWIADFDIVAEEAVDMNWWTGLDIEDWISTDSAVYYKRSGSESYLVFYKEQNLLLKYFATY